MTDKGPSPPRPQQRSSLPSIATPAERENSLQIADLPTPPETVVVPPTPITPSPSNSGPKNHFLGTAPQTTLQPTPEENVYESPDESSDMDASSSPRSSREPSSSNNETPEASSRRALPPHAVPHRVASTPVPRSEMMAPVQGKERDDSALLQSPPAFVPAGLPNASPHLFSAQRTPSPSSPGPSGFKDRMMRAHKRQSSAHVVRETTLGLQHEDDEGARVVNQYKIGHSLGKGAYASVELGIDVATGEKYAIKEFSKARLQKQALMERQAQQARERRERRPVRPGMKAAATEPGKLPQMEERLVDDEMLEHDPLALIRREVAVMKKLDHPNLTKLFEAISVPKADGLFLVLEYLPGGVLMKVEAGHDSTNEKPPFTEDEAREYFRQICLGLEYLHANGIAHRDIKPDNILFTEDRTMVKLADFGVSEMFQGDDTIKTSGGSPAFLSPESFNASIGEVHGKAVDIWALGVTLYCMLRGFLPFNVANPIELMWMVRDKEPDIPDHWHRDLQKLMKGMLRKDPRQRFTMDEIRENSWVNAWGQQPMMSVEDNLFYFGNVFEEPTEEEVGSAIVSLRSVFTVMSIMPEVPTGQSPSDVSLTSGSMDSYILPDAVTGLTTPSEMSEDDRPGIVDSPEREETPTMNEAEAETKKPGGWARLRPLKTDMARAGQQKHAKTMPERRQPQFTSEPELIATSPVEVGSPTCMSPVEVCTPEQVASPLAASPVDVHDSPNMLAESPILMAASPVDVESAVLMADSPVMAESPLMAESLVMADSPVLIADSPVMAESPVRADSPVLLADSPVLLADSPELAATPPPIPPSSSSRATPVTRKIIPAMEPLSLDATPTQSRNGSGANTVNATSPTRL